MSLTSNEKPSKLRAKIFKALADPVRMKTMEFLGSGEKCVCGIVPYVEISQLPVSRHLAILRRRRLVKVERKETEESTKSLTRLFLK